MNLREVRDNILVSFEGKDTLNRRIWRDGRLKPAVLKRLRRIADDFIKFLKVKIPVEDIIFTGSMANYDWSQFSDIDLHIVTDFKKVGDEKLVQEFFNTKKKAWNDLHEIRIYGYDVELYVEDKKENLVAGAIYSIKSDKWVKKPAAEERDPDLKEVVAKAKPFMSMIDDLAVSAKYPSQRALDHMEIIKDKIKLMRTNGLSAHGEYSIENLAFKYLRRSGYLEKLSTLRTKVYDKLRSI